jgi:microcompartment protein CcmK/EutM
MYIALSNPSLSPLNFAKSKSLILQKLLLLRRISAQGLHPENQGALAVAEV